MSGEFVVPLPMIMSLANVVSGKMDERLLVFGYKMLFKFFGFSWAFYKFLPFCRWAFVLAVVAVLDAWILGCLAFVLAHRHVKPLASYGGPMHISESPYMNPGSIYKGISIYDDDEWKYHRSLTFN